MTFVLGNSLSPAMSVQDLANQANQAYAQHLAGLQNCGQLRYEYWAKLLHRLPLNAEEQAKVLAIVNDVVRRSPSGIAFKDGKAT